MKFMLLSAPSTPSSLSITVLHSTSASPHMPLPLAHGWAVGTKNPRQQYCPRTSGILPLPGEHLSVPEVEQRGEHNPGFLEGLCPPSTFCEQNTGFSSPTLLQGTIFGDQREAATRMGRCLVKHSGLQAGISPSYLLSTASSATGLNSRKYGLGRAKSCFLQRKETAAEYLGQQMSTELH